ncbi:MAG: Ig-like domain-containing protein [Spirochaetaceae bacterium]|nr:Ig-like domain-containing protein [Spirochaetaceae bacterium]
MVRFDTAMDKGETQKALSVSFAGGTVSGDLAWQGDDLFFTPLEFWLPGVRYTLNLAGTIYALDGRESRVVHHVPFYALTRETAPYGLSFSPPDGASVGVDPLGDAFIRVVFSQPMDRQSTADAFSLDGVSKREFRWSEDDMVMEVYPLDKLNPWTLYHWTLRNKARGRSGVPLGKEIGGTFITDADRLLPAVSEVYPLVKGGADSGLRWIRTGAPMEDGFGSGQAIGVEFNKPMDESILRNIRFEPSLTGRAEMWTPLVMVFIPGRDPEPERIYTMYISGNSTDTGGLKMEKEFSLSFIAGIPYLTVLSLDAGQGPQDAEQNGIYPARTILPEGIVTVTLRFSYKLALQAQADAVLALSMEPYFPRTLRPVSLRSARWWSADTLIIQWEGIEPGSGTEEHYYRLSLPGGRGAIEDGKGSYLKEDLFFFFRGDL